MLEGLTFGSREELARIATEEGKRKHKKDKKKQKKEKQRKHKDRDASSAGGADSGSRSPGEHGSPPGSPQQAADEQRREDWMTVPMTRSQPAAAPPAEPPQQPRKQPEEEELHVGLRIMDVGGPPAVPGAPAPGAGGTAAAPAAAAGAGPARKGLVGDGGASWRLKALKRAQQQAKEQGTDVQQFLAERWGSAAELTKSLTEGRIAHGRAHLHESAWRQRQRNAGGGGGGDDAAPRGERSERAERGGDGGGDGGGGGDRGGERARGEDGPAKAGAAHYLRDVRGERAQMMRPGCSGGGLSWRRPGGGEHGGGVAAGGGVGGGGGRDGAAGGAADERVGGAVREDASHSGRGRDPGEAGSPPRRGGGGGRHREEARGEDAPRPDRRRADGGGGRREDARAGRGGGDGRGGGGGGGARHMRREDAAVLHAVAGELNAFDGDGSFLERFTQQQQQQQGGQQGGQQQQRQEAGKEEEREGMRRGGGREQVAGTEPPLLEEGGGEGRRGARCEAEQEGRVPGGGGSGAVAPSGGGAAARAPRAPLSAPPAATTNRDVAAALRARITGGAAAAAADNRSVAAALRARVSGGDAPGPAADAAADADAPAAKSRRSVEVLPLVDAQGRAAPGAFGREGAGAAARAREATAGGRPPKRLERYGADGKRERFYADDDDADLQTLVKRARHGDDGGDVDAALARGIASSRRYKASDFDADAEYDHDAGVELAEGRRRRGDAQQATRAERQRLVTQHRRTAAREDACAWCLTSARRVKALTLALGTATYLTLVPKGRLVAGHCAIVAAEHSPSMRQVDESVWTEVRNFQKCLIQMWMAQGLEALFMETAMHLGGGRAHAVLECIPMPPEAMAKAPMYFKKALMESESEWAQHAAKAAIDTRAKGLRGSVPPGFPYFYVQFGYANGFVHVIDDEKGFDAGIGRQTVVGLLKLPPELMHQRQRTDAPAQQERMAADFRRQFDPYDWTKQL